MTLQLTLLSQITAEATIARLYFELLESTGIAVTDAVAADFTDIKWDGFTNQVRLGGVRPSVGTLTDGTDDTDALLAGRVINHGDGVYSADCSMAGVTSDVVFAVPEPADGSRLTSSTIHPRSKGPVTGASGEVTTDAASRTASQATGFSTHSAGDAAAAVWSAGSRTLTAISDSSGIATLLTRITGLLQVKSEADADQAAVMAAISVIAGSLGPGSEEYTEQFTDGTNPIQGAEVWVTTDAAGSNVIAGNSYTDTSGNVTFMLDPGSYYMWVYKPGFNFTNPNPFTVPSP